MKLSNNKSVNDRIEYIDSLLDDDLLLEKYINNTEEDTLSSPKGLKEAIYKKITEYDMKEALEIANTKVEEKAQNIIVKKFKRTLKIAYVAIVSITISGSFFSFTYNNEKELNKTIDHIIEASNESMEITHNILLNTQAYYEQVAEKQK